MEHFVYRRATSPDQALRALRRDEQYESAPIGQFIAGGTNLTDYMTLGVSRPQVLVDINPLQQELGKIEFSDAGLRLGALVRMAEAEDHPRIRRDYPVVAQTLSSAASRQIRNMASLGGNVLQRTRCEYFREVSWACNKRTPGSGCAALEGLQRQHAILGTSEHCIASYPGDFAQALMALDATVETLGGAAGPRTLPFASLHRPPGETPHIETSLAAGELIIHFNIPAGPWTRRSCFVKVRDRESYQFALASAAVALHLEGERIRAVRIALGGVAAVPWRAREAEALLEGQRWDATAVAQAAEAAFSGARPYAHNAFKIQLGQQIVVRALMQAQQMPLSS